MENVQARKQELQGMIDSRKKQLEEGVSLANKGVIEAEITSFENELTAIEEAEQNEQAQMVRIQTQVENKEGLALYVQELDMFESFFPKKRYAEVMGLSEYEEKLQTFNQVLLQSFEQIEDRRNEKHNADIAERDEKIVALKSAIKQNSDEYSDQIKVLSETVDSLGTQNEELIKNNEKLDTDNLKLATSNDELMIETARYKTQVENLTSENEKLKDQLEASKALAPKPTASITDLLNQAKIKSAAEIALERTTPFRGPVVIGDVVAPPIALGEAGFPNQTNYPIVQLDSGTAEQNTADHQEVTAPVEQFQGQEEVHTGAGMDSETPSEDGQGTVTREEFEALKGKVDHLYRVANISEVA